MIERDLMTSEPTLLMAGQTREALREKFRQPPEPLSSWWRHFQILARNDPFWFSSYGVLAFVITGEDVYRYQARDLFVRFVRAKDAGLLTKEVQFHTHTASAPLGRLMALYDWIAGTDLLSPAEDAAFREAALDFATQVPLQQLQGRARMFDNQVFSNAFGAAVTGYVLGVRRGDSPLGRRLYSVGMEWLLDQFSRLPSGCYSGEGSTYHMLVVMPLLTLAGVFVEETTGRPVGERGIAPAFSPLRDWLEMARNLVGPAGLMPGWDAYGVFPSSVRAPLAWLARCQRDADALALIRDAEMWYPFAHVAWDFDDRMWTLVWWPADLEPACSAPFYPWMNPASAGALQDGRTRTRLFQYWDECGGGPFNGRANVNPNAIELQSRGLPVLLDGLPSVPYERLQVDEQAALKYLPSGVMDGLRRMLGQPDTTEGRVQALKQALTGSVGDSNSLIVDGENWYVPLHAVAGKGLALHEAGSLQVIESDATDYYRDRYDVTTALRISALVAGDTLLCLDEWASRTPHRLSWQAFTWPGASATAEGGVRADIGGQLQLDLLAGQGGQWDLTSVPGSPKSPCGGSTRVQFHLPSAVSAGRLLMGMAVQEQLDPGEDLSDGWILETPALSRTGVDLRSFYLGDESPSGTPLTFRRRFSLPAAGQDHPLYLRIASSVLAIQVRVNGVEVSPLYVQSNIEIQGSTSSFPHLLAIGSACHAGENEIMLAVRSFHGESIRGPLTLHRPRPVAPMILAAAGPDRWRVGTGTRTHCVLLGSRETCEWQGGRTDARHALESADGELAFAGVSTAEFPARDLSIKSNLPVDVAVAASTLSFGPLPSNAHVVLRQSAGRLFVSSMTVLHVSCSIPGAVIRLRLNEPRECFLNGCRLGRRGGPGDRQVEWTVPVGAGGPMASAIRTEDDVYRFLDHVPADVDGRLDACLRSGDWRIQMAAADVAGLLDMRGAASALLSLLEQEEARPPHPPITRSWSESKMNQALEEGVDHTPDTTIDPVEGAKRYRLKRALFMALGRLGDHRAVGPLERIMARGSDFFPALSQVPVALARLGSSTSVPVLEAQWDHGEVNVRVHVRLALAFLKGEITRTEFEARVNPG